MYVLVGGVAAILGLAIGLWVLYVIYKRIPESKYTSQIQEEAVKGIDFLLIVITIIGMFVIGAMLYKYIVWLAIAIPVWMVLLFVIERKLTRRK